MMHLALSAETAAFLLYNPWVKNKTQNSKALKFDWWSRVIFRCKLVNIYTHLLLHIIWVQHQVPFNQLVYEFFFNICESLLCSPFVQKQ